MTIEAVIFDWAGTTVDYGSFAPVAAFDKLFKEQGLSLTIDEIRQPMGMLKRDHIKTLLNLDHIHAKFIKSHPEGVTDMLLDNWNARFTEFILESIKDHAHVKPHTLEAVKCLREKRIKIGSTTGYTDAMMRNVLPVAKEDGYQPDTWLTPDQVGGKGRPYPFMIFENLKRLDITSVKHVIKIGDTISDIKEGLNAGVYSVGVIEGSSVMAMTKAEYDALNDSDKADHISRVRNAYVKAGADHVLLNLSELPALIERLSE